VIIAALVRRSAVQSLYVLAPCLVLLAGFQLIIVAQAASIESTRSFERMAELIPAFLQRGLGGRAMLLASFNGTVTFGYFHPVIAIMVSVLAIYMASEPAYDVESGLVDLVLARSIPRHWLITRSLLLFTAVTLAAGLSMAFGTWIGLHTFASPASNWPTPRIVGLLVVHLVSVGWCFGALGLTVAAGARRWSGAFAPVTLGAVALYLIEVLAIGWAPARTVAWISPFRYYPALPIVAGDPVGLTNVAVLLTAAAVLTATAYWRFNRRDL
jgi:ABC-type transport system involved in multi-copper enzyme maturation permease subunit